MAISLPQILRNDRVASSIRTHRQPEQSFQYTWRWERPATFATRTALLVSTVPTEVCMKKFEYVNMRIHLHIKPRSFPLLLPFNKTTFSFHSLWLRHDARDPCPGNWCCKIDVFELMIPTKQRWNAYINAPFWNSSQNAGSATVWPDFAPLTLFLCPITYTLNNLIYTFGIYTNNRRSCSLSFFLTKHSTHYMI